MKEILIFTDGACIPTNPGNGGWGYVIHYPVSADKVIEREASGFEPQSTNNRMELRGPIEAIKALKEPCKIRLYSDSQYVVRGIMEWIAGWAAKRFTKTKNPDLWLELVKVIIDGGHQVEFIWLRGHQDELNGRDFYVTMNCRADVLANGAAVNKQSSNRKLDDAPALTAKIDEFSRFQPADLKTVADLIVKQPPLI